MTVCGSVLQGRPLGGAADAARSARLAEEAKADTSDEATDCRRDPPADRAVRQDLCQVNPALWKDMRPRAEEQRGKLSRRTIHEASKTEVQRYSLSQVILEVNQPQHSLPFLFFIVKIVTKGFSERWQDRGLQMQCSGFKDVKATWMLPMGNCNCTSFKLQRWQGNLDCR